MASGESAYDKQHPGFLAEYEYANSDTGEVFSAPFPVAVFGIHKEFFGVGRVVGNIDDNPVIEVLDRDDGQPYYVMGSESWWTAPIPEEIVDNMTAGVLAIDSVAAYRKVEDEYWGKNEQADNSFLNNSGIDPSSLE